MANEMAPSVLICGYRQTGKDTLAKQLSDQSIPFNWRVYVSPNYEQRLVLGVQRTRVSFADELKRQVMVEEGIPPESYTEELKNTIIRDGKMFRDLLIEVATARRAVSPDCFVACAMERRDGTPFVVTDWRFPNEHTYICGLGINPTTVRVYCADVPRVDVESETSLDEVLTDYIMVRGENTGFLDAFPKYYAHVPVELGSN